MQELTVTYNDLQSAIRTLDLAGKAVCVHSSLRSFGRVEGGAEAIVQAFLDEGCTLLVPTFSYDVYAAAPPLHLRPQRNGWDYRYTYGAQAQEGTIYTPAADEIDGDMGAIPTAILRNPNHVRGDHPVNSFSALGCLAERLVGQQKPLAVFAPLQSLADVGGSVLLMGVALERMTLLHYAEEKAGRVPFRRWAYDRQGQVQMVQAGGCSDGFGKLEPYLHTLQCELMVGKSLWQLFPAEQTLEVAAAAMRANPQITHCGVADCDRCNDAVLGGPILE